MMTAANTPTFSRSFQRALDAVAHERAERVRQARKLVPTLVRVPRRNGVQPALSVSVSGPSGNEDVVFKGGKSEHTIKAAASDRNRILAHWEGYQRTNGYHVWKPGDRAGFHGPYSPARKRASVRTGTVVHVTPSRLRIEYIPLTSRTGEKHLIWVAINQAWEI